MKKYIMIGLILTLLLVSGCKPVFDEEKHNCLKTCIDLMNEIDKIREEYGTFNPETNPRGIEAIVLTYVSSSSEYCGDLNGCIEWETKDGSKKYSLLERIKVTDSR